MKITVQIQARKCLQPFDITWHSLS